MNILTFDIEEWFHILDHEATRSEAEWLPMEIRIHESVDRLLDLLAREECRATFFCLGWIGRRYPEVIRKIDTAGFEVACHSNTHQLVYGQTRAAFKEDTETAIKVLSGITGKPVRAFRAPGFSITPSVQWAFDILLEAGIEIDCSVFPARRAHGGFPEFGDARPSWLELRGGRLKQFPMSTLSFGGYPMVFSGGGYFRLLPYPIIRMLMRRSTYVMTYFHPRDFDPDQPVIRDLPWARQFKSYVGLKSAFGKLENLLRDFPFLDISQAESKVDWAEATVIRMQG